jgi:hypothetical protein
MSDERYGAGRVRLERLAAQARREAAPEPDVAGAVRARLAALVSGWIGYDAWLTLASPMADLLGYGSWLM